VARHLTLFLLLAGSLAALDFTPPLRDYHESSGPGQRAAALIGGSLDLHRGSDMVPNGLDWNVYAVAAGRVVTHFPPPGRGYRGHPIYGGMVILDHGLALSLYGHMKRTFVYEGQYVKQGQAIGIVGNTGMSNGAHLHLELIDQPERLLQWSAQNRTRQYWLRMSFKLL
jgi:murein DD-endopeptidase MepM/ murein hydrolase activator NlpD